jgi:hypothetical protein
MKSQRGAITRTLGLLLLLGATQAPVWAQQDTPPILPQGDGPKPAAAGMVLGPNQSRDSGPTVPSGPVNPYSGEIKEAGTGLPFFGTSSTPLRWGDFSIGRFEYVGLHSDSNYSAAATGTATDISMFRAGFIFDHYFWKSRLVLQYLPQLAIVDGQVHANASTNNTFNTGSKFVITPRLSVTLQNAFLQTKQNQLVPENYLATGFETGAVSQNNFLTSNGNYLSNTVSAAFQYDLTPRTSFSVTPSFGYANTTSTSGTAQYSVDGQVYQMSMSLSHALTAHRQVGISESFEYLRQTSGIQSYARYSTTAVSYSEQIAPFWWITGNVGTAHEINSNQPGAGNWSFSGGATLVGSLSRILGVALAYSRGTSFNNYVSTRLSDRIDASLALKLSSRMAWTNGFGYFREAGTDPRASGKYAMSQVAYQFYGNFSLFTAFAHTFQNSNTQQLPSGTQNTVEFGLNWRPPANPGHR